LAYDDLACRIRLLLYTAVQLCRQEHPIDDRQVNITDKNMDFRTESIISAIYMAEELNHFLFGGCIPHLTLSSTANVNG
jgi:hypothetical protein